MTNTLSECKASGTFVLILNDPAYGFDSPLSLSDDDGVDVWVANGYSPDAVPNNSLTEISASTGVLIKYLSG